jgi:hypothetical protein
MNILETIEQLLPPRLSPCGYYDYVACTDAGGMIAIGMSVKEIVDLYLDNGAAMLDKAGIIRCQRAQRAKSQSSLGREAAMSDRLDADTEEVVRADEPYSRRRRRQVELRD